MEKNRKINNRGGRLFGTWEYTGKIVQQSLAWFFNSGWHDFSTATGTILQQPLARLFNRHWHDSSTVTGRIIQQSRADFYFFLCWHNSSTVKITVEESCHVPGIRYMIRIYFEAFWWRRKSVATSILSWHQ